ncbi:hypothetical protein [Hymenobacter sp. GOD-10R]|uniref:hypothetical protein n=1 Tax=Hymenobacter sp. GOD-10R TaxID=3093922 RepID=UPI002D79EF29|nr:hypothetical protein [Hymenobacter sp. GOD-10R]WRQ30694.1 hypothetical protein SD425_10520 [Hymenobacter sp. GOD-10R]
MNRLLLLLLGVFLFRTGQAQQRPVDSIIRTLRDPSCKQVLVAHRGDWRNAPKNSLLAIEKGVDLVEIDLKKSKAQEKAASMSASLLCLSDRIFTRLCSES